MFYYLTMSGTMYQVTDDEHRMITKSMAQKKTHHAFKNGELILFSTITEVMTEERFKTRDREILSGQGKWRCKYGTTHWHGQQCTCQPLPGEATHEEIKKNNRLISESKKYFTGDDKKQLGGVMEDETGLFYISNDGEKTYS